MSDWKVHRLPDALTFREGPGILAVDFRQVGTPLIRLSGLKSTTSRLAGCDYLDPDMVDLRWSQFRLALNDVLLSTSASLGEVAVVDEAAVGAVPYTGIIGFRPATDRVDWSFVPWMLRAPSFKRQIEAMGVGSVMRHFGPSHLRAMTVTFPPVDQQRAIAGVLGALDDKIVANAELARTADELASSLFARAVAGVESGPDTFGSLCSVGGGGTPKTSEPSYWQGAVAWATPTDVTRLRGPYLRFTARLITEAGLKACASPLYPVDSILMTSRATIGAFALAKTQVAVNQGFIVVNPIDPGARYWIFHEMRSRVEEFTSFANGATFLELSRGNFKKLPVRLADKATISGFSARARELHDLGSQILTESDTLAELRDTLLPHLMSGRLKVRDAEKVVGDAL